MYSLSQSKGTTKLLLQSGRQDYGTNDNPTFVLNEVVQAPPFSFGLIGVEKMYWRQPPLFPSAYMTCTMTSIPLTGTSVAQTLTPTAASFTQSVTMNGVTMLMNLADTYYDGSTWWRIPRTLTGVFLVVFEHISGCAFSRYRWYIHH